GHDYRVGSLHRWDPRRGRPLHELHRNAGRSDEPRAGGGGQRARGGRHRAPGDHDPHSRHPWCLDPRRRSRRERRDRRGRYSGSSVPPGDARGGRRRCGGHSLQGAPGDGDGAKHRQEDRQAGYGVLLPLLRTGRRGRRREQFLRGAVLRNGGRGGGADRGVRGPHRANGDRRWRGSGGGAGRSHPLARVPFRGGADLGCGGAGSRVARGDGAGGTLLRRGCADRLGDYRDTCRFDRAGVGAPGYGAAGEVQL
ncbi:Sodium/calcium exchanger membrane region, partial [uncultured Rubrobacteraceae bacterium]